MRLLNERAREAGLANLRVSERGGERERGRGEGSEGGGVLGRR